MFCSEHNSASKVISYESQPYIPVYLYVFTDMVVPARTSGKDCLFPEVYKRGTMMNYVVWTKISNIGILG